MKTLNFYDTRYRTSESRILFIIAQKTYGNFTKMSQALFKERQHIQDWIKNERVPLKYVSFLGRKFKFHPALLAYSKYVLLGGEQPYEALLVMTSYFNIDEKKFILEGQRESNRTKILKASDGEIKGK